MSILVRELYVRPEARPISVQRGKKNRWEQSASPRPASSTRSAAREGGRRAVRAGKVVPGEVWTTSRQQSPLKDLEDSTDEDEQSCSGRPLFGRLFPCVDLRTGTTSPKPIQPASLWTSTLKRTIDTARHIPHPVLELSRWGRLAPDVSKSLSNLDEIFAGDCEGLTYEEIERQHGNEARLRKRDKLGYRCPRGESYLDLIARLDPLMHEARVLPRSRCWLSVIRLPYACSIPI